MKVSEEFIDLLFDEIYVVKEKQNSVQFKYCGNNAARLLHVIDFDMNNDENKIESAQLKTIIEKGLLLSIDDNSIVYINDIIAHDWTDVINFFVPHKIIIWGCPAYIEKYFEIQDYEIKKQLNTYILKAEAIKEYISSNEKKQKLWVQIKKINTLV